MTRTPTKAGSTATPPRARSAPKTPVKAKTKTKQPAPKAKTETTGYNKTVLGIAAGATIGSAAIAAALLYYRRSGEDKPIGSAAKTKATPKPKP